jgi:hypothetical protein
MVEALRGHARSLNDCLETARREGHSDETDSIAAQLDDLEAGLDDMLQAVRGGDA